MKNISLSILWTFSCSLLSSQLVEVNQANADQLNYLPGIGSALAKKILEHRKLHGSFKKESDLLAVAGMSKNKLENIKDMISFKDSSTKPTKKSKTKNDFVAPLVMELALLENIVLACQNLNLKVEDDMMNRIKKQGAIPKVSLKGDLGKELGTREKKSLKEDSLINKNETKYGITVKLEFDLPKLLFHEAEIDVVKTSLRILDEREKVIQNLHKSYFKYKKLLKNRSEEQDSDLWGDIDLELTETKAILDFLSCHNFSKN